MTSTPWDGPGAGTPWERPGAGPAAGAGLAEVRERARAAFLGLALGDALGATVEFMTAGEIRAAHGIHRELSGGGWLRLKPGRVTDDTEMSVAAARALVAAGGWSLQAVAEGFATWLKGRPTDAGHTCRAGIRRFIIEGTLQGSPGAWDAGNGGVMRVLPVALLDLGDPAALARQAVEQARITHHHPLSDAACVLVAELVQLACLGHPLEDLRAAAGAAVAAEPRFAWLPWRGLSTGYVVDTLQTVLHALFGTGSFEDCLVEVVNRGGDADTTGAIAGAIAGALYGPAGLPRRWLRRLDRDLVSEVERLAGRLVDLSPLGSACGARSLNGGS